MANQNIGTPRFYIDLHQYALINGLVDDYTSAHLGDSGSVKNIYQNGLKPVASFESIQLAQTHGSWIIKFTTDFWTNLLGNTNGYFALFNHNLKSLDAKYAIDAYDSGGDHSGSFSHIEYINGTSPEYDGWSLSRFTYTGESHLRFYFAISPSDDSNWSGGEIHKTGGASFGITYDMPHSPELSLTMAHEYDGVKKQETAGGSTLSYVNYYKPPDWGDLQAWQLDGWDRKYSGRRVWDLTFNHLSDSDLEPYNYYIDSSSGHSNWNDDGNWFTNVIHYTNGGQLPFIFCPDPSIVYDPATNTIPEFAICRFDMKTFKREQVANGVYNIKVKIEESW